jgi:hypothetical protein
MGGTRIAYDGVEIYLGIWQEFVKERGHLDDLGLYGRRLLKSEDKCIHICSGKPCKCVGKYELEWQS